MLSTAAVAASLPFRAFFSASWASFSGSSGCGGGGGSGLPSSRASWPLFFLFQGPCLFQGLCLFQGPSGQWLQCCPPRSWQRCQGPGFLVIELLELSQVLIVSLLLLAHLPLLVPLGSGESFPRLGVLVDIHPWGVLILFPEDSTTAKVHSCSILVSLFQVSSFSKDFPQFTLCEVWRYPVAEGSCCTSHRAAAMPLDFLSSCPGPQTVPFPRDCA